MVMDTGWWLEEGEGAMLYFGIQRNNMKRKSVGFGLRRAKG